MSAEEPHVVLNDIWETAIEAAIDKQTFFEKLFERYPFSVLRMLENAMKGITLV